MKIGRELSTPSSDLRDVFLSLESRRDLAKILDYRYSALVYRIYKTPEDQNYEVFEISKKTGGSRIIASPSPALKEIQRRLAYILQNVYIPKPVVYGFVEGKNVVENAHRHKRKQWVLNVDLDDFFPSINFGRVRGLFLKKPYYLPESVATLIAKICCFNGKLPQGAPTSPVISNMICAKMDSELQDLAWNCRCFYTRYADDITFSTTLPIFPIQIAKVYSLLDVEIGKDLEKIIISNGFTINSSKTRAFSYKQRQEVTGLTVNKHPNVSREYLMQIRAMLHAWKKYGVDLAEAVHNQLYRANHRNPKKGVPSFKKVVKGKIEYLGMVKGKENKTYQLFKRQYHDLLLQEKGLRRVKSFDEKNSDKRPRVYTEGVTDAMILEVAWEKLYKGIYCPFIIKDCSPTRSSRGSTAGASVLKNYLKNIDEDTQILSIGIFDKDDEGVNSYNDIGYVAEQEDEWKISLQRKAGCFTLLVPQGRERYAENKNLCIEYLFDDEIIEYKNKDNKDYLSHFTLAEKK